jgi:hypothetical protein
LVIFFEKYEAVLAEIAAVARKLQLELKIVHGGRSHELPARTDRSVRRLASRQESGVSGWNL